MCVKYWWYVNNYENGADAKLWFYPTHLTYAESVFK
jgi:hypothetical protein